MRIPGVSNPFAFYILFADGVARAAEQVGDFDRPRPLWAKRRRLGGVLRRVAGRRAV